MRNPPIKISLHVSLFGLACFIVSQLLPAVQAKVLGAPAVFMGWQATVWAVGLGIDSLTNMARFHTWEDIGHVVRGVAGVLNFVFVITPVVLIWGTVAKGIWRVLMAISLAGLLFAFVTPLTLEDMHPSALSGYYVWLLAYVVLLAALALAWKVQRK
jgi:hypothetical protein